MYPHQELIRLGAHKAALRRRITLRRDACVSAAARATRPVAWLDGVLGVWRRLPPLARYAVIPLGLWLRRSAAPRPRLRLLGVVLRWAPLVLGAVRGLMAGRRA